MKGLVVAYRWTAAFAGVAGQERFRRILVGESDLDKAQSVAEPLLEGCIRFHVDGLDAKVADSVGVIAAQAKVVDYP